MSVSFGSNCQIPVLIWRCNSDATCAVTSTHITIILESLTKPGDDTPGDSKFLGYFQLGTSTFHSSNNSTTCQVIYSQFGSAIHQNDHQARRRFVEWAQNEIAVVPDFHKRILFSDEAHFWVNGYVNKQNCRILSETNPQVYVETPLHPEKLTVWCALWAGGILLQKR
ncbi:putative DD41D transposase [Trichonephila clavipes]|nr:putative DD41D transposase [Trichonephila clavipes]